jgi:valyl-tRNA synthetase
VWRFINKVRNASRYVSLQLEDQAQQSRSYEAITTDLVKHMDQLNEYDHRMLGKINETI